MSYNHDIVDAKIEDLTTALASGALTSVDLVTKYLLRISTYDCRNTQLNSTPLLNENVFNEAAAADERRWIGGKSRSPLDGVPFTIKDSYKAKGMTVASGSRAFKDLLANEDAFTVASLKDAGAILLGKTNMCPMAYGGMLRGLYGRAESPYNLDYLPAAFGSGSSNGSAVSVAASFAAFGMGEETVSSGRSPASNNALVAYTPSRGYISIRGNWPLYPTCDVVVPHTRSMDDLLMVLRVITAKDNNTSGDFWRDQPFVPIPAHWTGAERTLANIKEPNYLRGKRIAVPKMYVRQQENGPFVSEAIEPLFHQAQADLEAAGAKIELLDDFPVLSIYEKSLSNSKNDLPTNLQLPDNWNATERGMLIAYAWEDFLQNNQSLKVSSLSQVDPKDIFPQLPRDDPQVKFTEPANAVQWSKLASFLENRQHTGNSYVDDTPNLDTAVKALEEIRKHCFEKWMDEHEFDFVAFPAAGDVARADSDIDYGSAEHSWRDGVKYSHGNRALRHLGIPSITVPMGMLKPHNMPMGLTFLGRAYDDEKLLKAASAFEQKSKRRITPPLTPALASDTIRERDPTTEPVFTPRPELSLTSLSAKKTSKDNLHLSIKGSISVNHHGASQQEHNSDPIVEIYIDGTKIPTTDIHIETVAINQGNEPMVSQFSVEHTTACPPTQDSRNQVEGKIARDSTMVIITARNGTRGLPSGILKLIHASEYQ